ncbi:hypothetical protein BSKO_12178 [Bryopsis sp. KO-2023]|nr:hypothetical protein BSKO_12178 [Bryopsis sp. KO-2023]
MGFSGVSLPYSSSRWVASRGVQRRLRNTVVASSGKETSTVKSDDGDAFAEQFRTVYRPDQGQKIVYGVFKRPVDLPKAKDGTTMSLEEYFDSSAEERAELRRQAAKDLVVIDKEERERRMLVGQVFLAITLAIDAVLVFSHAGFFPRLATYFPFTAGAAMYASGKTGL